MTNIDQIDNSAISGERTLASLVTEYPGAARVFDRWGLDYCCEGKRSLAVAATALGVDSGSVIADLEALGAAKPADWAGMGPAEMTEHIESTHHELLWEELPRLHALAMKVNSVHGGRHAELAEVLTLVAMMRSELEPHMTREESVLFPAIRELAVSTTRPSFRFGSVTNPISVLMQEHDNQGRVMDRLIEVTDGYSIPADGCASYSALYSGLRELDEDTRLHVHKENNLLFPAVQELEAKLLPA